MCQQPITLYRVFDPEKGYQYFETLERAELLAAHYSKNEPGEIISVDYVRSLPNVAEAVEASLLGIESLWHQTEVISFWETGERYGESSGESPKS